MQNIQENLKLAHIEDNGAAGKRPVACRGTSTPIVEPGLGDGADRDRYWSVILVSIMLAGLIFSTVFYAYHANAEDFIDLAVSPDDINFSPANVSFGNTANITALIHNLGSMRAVGVSVSFFSKNGTGNEVLISTTSVLDISANGSNQVSVLWLPTETGDHTITVRVAHYLSENNTSNNEANKSISVGSGVPVPDLTVTDVRFSNSHPAEGDNVSISATIKNNGAASAADVSVTFYIDGQYFAGQGITSIDTVNVATVGVQWTAVSGDHLINVTVDPNNKVMESNENNNWYTKTISTSQKNNTPGFEFALIIVSLAAISVLLARKNRA